MKAIRHVFVADYLCADSLELDILQILLDDPCRDRTGQERGSNIAAGNFPKPRYSVARQKR